MKIERCAIWTPEIEALIQSAIASGSLADIKAQVNNGAQLWAVNDDDYEALGAFVLRIDHFQGFSEGVLVAGAGQIEGVDCTALVLPIVEKMFTGCQSMRIHTNRPGLMKKLVSRYGYSASEIILRKAL
jgi:hypothetical protein